MKQKKLVSIICTLTSLLACTVTTSHPILEEELKTIPQDLNAYANKAGFSSQTADERQHRFVTEYFSPWDNPYKWYTAQEMKKRFIKVTGKHLQGDSWGFNRQRLDKKWIQSQIINSALSTFPSQQSSAIIVADADLRFLPTQTPIYRDWRKPGEGYPFDHLQNSHLRFNTPVAVLHTSQDKSWLFVVAGDKSMGWVPAQTVSQMNKRDIQQFNSKQFVTVTKPGQSLLTTTQKFITTTKVGQIFPVAKSPTGETQILVAVNSKDANAEILSLPIDKTSMQAFPLAFDHQTLAKLGNQLYGTPYGWGGLLGYLDCSALLQDLFASVGVWLPRDSLDQIQLTQDFVDISQLSAAEKRQALRRNAIPFQTLVFMPGHIALYIGADAEHLYLFHTPWAVRTFDPVTQQEGRAVIGRAVVTTLRFGEQLDNVDKTWLDKITTYRVIT